MKTTLLVLMMIIFLGQTFRQPMIFINYQINKEVIIKTLCENKDKPELKCNGKCHLSKKLKESAENQQSTTTKIAVQKTDLYFESEIKFDYPPVIQNILVSSYQDILKDQPTSPLFRPPIS